jgi:hypothetical protein
LSEEHGEELALHAPGELCHFLLASEEIRPRLLGKRGKAEPWIVLVDGGGRILRRG